VTGRRRRRGRARGDRGVLLRAAALVAGAIALAAAPPARAEAASPAQTLAVAPSAPTPRAPDDDPQADRGVLMPTATTHPRGTLFVSDYDVLVVQIGYAVTDDTQLSLTAVPRLGQEQVTGLDVTLKTSLFRGARVRVAALGSASGGFAKDTPAVGVGRVGGVVQLCLEARCDSSLSMSSDVVLAGALIMANGVSGIFRVSPRLALLGELDTLVPLGNLVDGLGGALAGGGLRVLGAHWGFDATALRTFRGAWVPFLALTYRS
jgi:hypothetical protein